MISNATVYSFIIAAIFTLVLPIAILVAAAAKKRVEGLPLLAGAAAFFLSQIVLRIPILNAFSGQEWFRSFAEYYVPFILIISLSAGIFEESARLGGALLLKKLSLSEGMSEEGARLGGELSQKRNRGFKDIVSFGIGHAFCEVIIMVGFTHINNVVLCMAINGSAGTLAEAFPPDVLEAAAAQLAAVDSFHVYLGIIERISAVMFHIFATILVFKGVNEENLQYYVLAILAHTMFNFIGVFLASYAGLVISEAAILVMAIAAGYYVVKKYPRK